MKKPALTYVLLSAFAITPLTASPLLASPSAQDRDQDRDRTRDESAYRNNRYYKQGWKDGERHKHKEHRWKNEDDRRAYEAGYSHGDRGEKWQTGDHDRDHDHH